MPVPRKPQVGDTVDFFSTNKDHQFNNAGKGPYAALVTHVHDHETVDLRVFPSRADGFGVTSVMPYGAGMQWWWAFRKDGALDAAIAEAAERALAEMRARDAAGIPGEKPLAEPGGDA